MRSGRNARRSGPVQAVRGLPHQFIRNFGLKAFRRPLEPAESRGTRALPEAADFLAARKLVVEAMLQSPNFLFRLEDTTNREVAALRRGQPALLRALGHDAGRGAVRQQPAAAS